jgi:N-ethylmaleimide reductase
LKELYLRPAVGSTSPPRTPDISQIPVIVDDYPRAAERAKAAGFDGVELHSADGYLPDRFLQDSTNERTDAHGGSNRESLSIPALSSGSAGVGFGRTIASLGESGPEERLTGCRMESAIRKHRT